MFVHIVDADVESRIKTSRYPFNRIPYSVYTVFQIRSQLLEPCFPIIGVKPYYQNQHPRTSPSDHFLITLYFLSGSFLVRSELPNTSRRRFLGVRVDGSNLVTNLHEIKIKNSLGMRSLESFGARIRKYPLPCRKNYFRLIFRCLIIVSLSTVRLL